MAMKRVATFTITEDHVNGYHEINVEPALTNINRLNGGENILLAIAANCVRMIAKRDGLEKALDRFNHIVINQTRFMS